MISRFTAALAWVFLVWFAAPLPLLAQAAPEASRITHVYGLFFSADGARQQIPGHRGIASYERGGWTGVPCDAIWYGTHSKRAKLVRKSLGPKLVEHELTLPYLYGDAVAFFAFNPVVRGEMAIATTPRNVFISRNSGKDWIQIVHEGETGA